MAFLTKLVLPLLLCLVLMQECNSGHGCCFAKAAAFQEVQNRKVLVKEVALKSTSVHGTTSITGKGGNLFGWDLRKVPSGPDPLHHNGGNPKKPRTP